MWCHVCCWFIPGSTCGNGSALNCFIRGSLIKRDCVTRPFHVPSFLSWMSFVASNEKSSNIKLHDYCWLWKWKVRTESGKEEGDASCGSWCSLCLDTDVGTYWGGPLKGNQLLPENEVRTQEFWAFGGCSPSRLWGRYRSGDRWHQAGFSGSCLLYMELSFSGPGWVQKSQRGYFDQASFFPPSFCYLPHVCFLWHWSAAFLKLLANNLHFTFCWHCGRTVNAPGMFLGSCIIAATRVDCAICSVTNGLIRTWKIYKQFNRSHWFPELFSARQGWANGNGKDGGVQLQLRLGDWSRSLPAKPANRCSLACWGCVLVPCSPALSLECPRVILSGSYGCSLMWQLCVFPLNGALERLLVSRVLWGVILGFWG